MNKAKNNCLILEEIQALPKMELLLSLKQGG